MSMAVRAPSPGRSSETAVRDTGTQSAPHSGERWNKSHRNSIEGALLLKRNVHRFLQHITTKLNLGSHGHSATSAQPSSDDQSFSEAHTVHHHRPPHPPKRHHHHHHGLRHPQPQQHVLDDAPSTGNQQQQSDAAPSAVPAAAPSRCSLEPFLVKAGIAELAFTTLLSDLSNIAYNVDDPAWRRASPGGGIEAAASAAQQGASPLDNWLVANQLTFVSCSETRAHGPLPERAATRRTATAAATAAAASPPPAATAAAALKAPAASIPVCSEADSQQFAMTATAKQLLTLSVVPESGAYGEVAAAEALTVSPARSPRGSSPRLFRPDVE